MLMPNTIVAGNQIEIINMDSSFIDDKMKKCCEWFGLLKELIHDIKGLKLKEAKAAFYAAVGIDFDVLDIKTASDFA